MAQRVKVLHVTEAFAAGVLTLIDSLSRRQGEVGARTSVWFLSRPETPDDATLRSRFQSDVNLVRLAVNGSRFRAYLSMASRIRTASRSGEFDAIHLHSSKAGLIGRIATLGPGRTARIFYSPHGFAFLRLDTSRMTRLLVKLLERVMANMGDGLILTSASELKLARGSLYPRRSYLLRTGISPHDFRDLDSRPVCSEAQKQIVVGMVGRVTYQKAPWRFAQVARELSGQAKFLWIGDGPSTDIDRWLGDAEVEIAGWLNPDALEAAMDQIDVLLFPTLWEGMSMALMQAQARGIPAVVSNAIGNVDSVCDGKTGFVCVSHEDFVNRTRLLIEDSELRHKMANSAVQWARSNLSDANLGEDSLKIYSPAMAASGEQSYV